MNLAQIATVVGQRLGVDTSSGLRDGAAVRSFLTMRHDQLYRAFLWRDSIIELETPINQPYTPTSIYMPTKARLILPSIFQHVLGVRLGWRGLNVQRPMLYTRADYGAFMSSGFTAEFMSLSSCVWEFDTVQNLFLQASNAADNNVGVTIDELQADEVSIARSVVNILQVGAPAGSTDRVDNLIKAITLGQVSLCAASASGNAPVSVVGISYVGSPVPTATVNVTQGVSYTITPGANENGIVLVNGSQTLLLASGTPITSHGAGNTVSFSVSESCANRNRYLCLSGSYVLNGLSPAVAYNIYWQPGTNEF